MARSPGRKVVLLVAASIAVSAAAAEPPETSPSRPLVLATFNIHHAEGADGVLDLGRVAEAVRGADVVAFQEVDVHYGERSRFEDQAARLGELLGGEVAFGANLVRGDARYGVALVSKFPIRSSVNHRLPLSPGRESREPRGLLEVEIEAPGGPLKVFATHLSHDSEPERLLQVDRLRALIAGSIAGFDCPWILMGDLNFRPDSAGYARLMGQVGDRPSFVDTWARSGRGEGFSLGVRGGHPIRIDYILASPDLASRLETIRVETESVASDHQPVIATFRAVESGR